MKRLTAFKLGRCLAAAAALSCVLLVTLAAAPAGAAAPAYPVLIPSNLYTAPEFWGSYNYGVNLYTGTIANGYGYASVDNTCELWIGAQAMSNLGAVGSIEIYCPSAQYVAVDLQLMYLTTNGWVQAGSQITPTHGISYRQEDGSSGTRPLTCVAISTGPCERKSPFTGTAGISITGQQTPQVGIGRSLAASTCATANGHTLKEGSQAFRRRLILLLRPCDGSGRAQRATIDRRTLLAYRINRRWWSLAERSSSWWLRLWSSEWLRGPRRCDPLSGRLDGAVAPMRQQ